MAYKKMNKKYKNKPQTNAEQIQEKTKKNGGYFGLFGSIVCTVICLFILLILLDSSYNYMNIYNNGNQTVGTIHQIIRRRGSRGRTNYTIYIQYRTGNIERVQRLESIGPIRRIASHPVGTNIRVRYHPDNPTTIIHATPADIRANAIGISILFGLGIIFGVGGIRHRYLYGKE